MKTRIMNSRNADLSSLEPIEVARRASEPFPRRKLGRLTSFLLIAMRIYVLLAVPIAAYAFVKALMSGAG
jgi:hypothetical protein